MRFKSVFLVLFLPCFLSLAYSKTRGAPSASAKVIVASAFGCALNSDINTGGGTDDSVCLQNALNTLSNQGGGELLLDGVALVSAANVRGAQTSALQIGPNTLLRCAWGGGIFLAPNSNVLTLGNAISGNPHAVYQTNIGIRDCTINANGQQQNRYELGEKGNNWVFGIWFGGVDGLTIENTLIRNSTTFAIVISNTRNVSIIRSAVAWNLGYAHPVGSGFNHDGLHFWGNNEQTRVIGFIDTNGDDDTIALNTNEGLENYNDCKTCWQRDRFPWSGGAVNDAYFDDIELDPGAPPMNGIRFIGYKTANSSSRLLNNIYFHNVHGVVSTVPMQNKGITGNTLDPGPITLDGWNVTGVNTINVPASSSLCLRNILPGTPIKIDLGAAPALNCPLPATGAQ
jgi:hypothetical protein